MKRERVRERREGVEEEGRGEYVWLEFVLVIMAAVMMCVGVCVCECTCQCGCIYIRVNVHTISFV